MKTESDYRVTYEVAKLMKMADYKEKVHASYNLDGELQHFPEAINFNELATLISAPLTAMALDWAESLGYYTKIGVEVNGLYKGSLNYSDLVGEYSLPITNSEVTNKDFDMAYLTAVCNHIINNK